MQSFKSQYGRKGIRVDDVVPTRALINRLGKTHVRHPASALEAEVRGWIARAQTANPEGWTPAIVAQTVRFALWRHAENLAEYQYVMGSH